VGYDPEKHHRRSIRLKGFDYSQPGPYFVTICLNGREPYFEIPEVRNIVENAWKTLPQRFPTIELDEFIVMPDHIHFILNLHPNHKNPSNTIKHRLCLQIIDSPCRSQPPQNIRRYLRQPILATTFLRSRNLQQYGIAGNSKIHPQ
jgi:REP element-mobilizing transposase RayT